MAKLAAKILGIIFVLVGLLGSVTPTLLGLHLSAAHNVIHILSAALSLYFGSKMTLAAARLFCIVFGTIYGLLGILGLLVGIPGTSNHLLIVIPRLLEFGTTDHILHIIFALIYLISGLLTSNRIGRAIPEQLESELRIQEKEATNQEQDVQPDPNLFETTYVISNKGLTIKSLEHSYDVFISYRREAGSESARLIRTELKRLNLRVFLDVDDLQAGYFDQTLLKCIADTPNFVVILSPNCLDRCTNEQDWFRREISQALNEQKNIVPIVMPGFQFPEREKIPSDIEDLRKYQGVTYSHEFFDAMIKKVSSYLRYSPLR